MSFSILISTFKNLEYLKLTIYSIKKNSYFDHEIIVHNNENDVDTKIFLEKNSILNSSSNFNKGLCSAINSAYKLSTKNLILYSHDDMYFLPKWDFHLMDELKNLKTKLFYLSATQISSNPPVKGNIQHIQYDCGSNIGEFDEEKLLKNFAKFPFRNLQGSHWAPHLVHRDLWDKIGGFSEEFDPGFASDPDLNMKLWKRGVRIFKGVSKSRVYHFGSLTTRKNKDIKKNNGKKTFLLKWGITVHFFTKHYLKRGTEFFEPLDEPKKNIIYFLDYLFSKMKFFIQK